VSCSSWRSRSPTITQLATFLQPTWQALLDGVRYVEPRLREIFAELDPDVIVEDNVPCFPAVVTPGRPWVRIISCNPAELKDAAVPPVFSGYPISDRERWEEFRAEYRRTHGPMWQEFDEFVRASGAPGLPDGPFGPEFIHESPWLNLYLYPAEADYEHERPLAPTWHRLESCVRATEAPFQLPEHLARPSGRLIYLSLGSLGSADVELMQRLIDILGRTDQRVIVSKGPQAELLTLHDNMWGEEFVPQPSILPLVDLVITHGGNNTVTECFYHGRPMIVLPLFWDQYDNAQRVDELGFGVRLATYAFDETELLAAIDRIGADRALHARMAGISRRLKANPGTLRAAGLIERLAHERRPVTRQEANA
jgi:MGT family glycosyltransferase